MRNDRKAGLFDAWFETGKTERDKERDKMLNKAGLNLAAFYVLAVKRPSKAEPLLLGECGRMFARLAHLGVGTKSGPGDRLLPSMESIGKAIDRLRGITSLCSGKDDDKRHTGWILRHGFPEVRVVRVGTTVQGLDPAPRSTIGTMCARHGSTDEISCCATASATALVTAALITPNGGRSEASPSSSPASLSRRR